jgi:hypothetical protein
MSDEQHPSTWVIERGRICDGILFATHRDRALYIGTITGRRQKWLEDHPGVWIRLEDLKQDRASPPNGVEIPSVAGTVTPVRTCDGSATEPPIGATDPGHPQATDFSETGLAQPALPVQLSSTLPGATALHVDDVITIGSRQCVTAPGLASMLKVSRRTLSRLCAGPNGPPKRRHGNMVLFELDEIAEWLGSSCARFLVDLGPRSEAPGQERRHLTGDQSSRPHR